MWTNKGLLVALCAQTAFLLYSLFSVDRFTNRVQQIVTRDPPDGLTHAMRALLLALMGVNLIAAVGAEAMSGAVIRLVERLRERVMRGRCARDGSPGVTQSLLLPGGLPAVVRGRSGGLPSPGGAPEGGGGVAAIHVPRMQRPAGAELL